VCLVGLAMRVSGQRTVQTPEAVSTISSVLMIALAGAIAARFLGGWAAAVALLFLAVSPLDLALARRAWQDDVMAFVTLLMFATALAAALRPRQRWWQVAFFVISAEALLVKESAVIPFGIGTLALAWRGWRSSGRWRGALPAVIGGALAMLAAGVALVTVSGGLETCRRVYQLAREATAPDDYMREYQSGGIGYYLTGLRILQPLPWLLGGVGALLALLRAPFLLRPWRHPAAGLVLFALALYVAGFAGVTFWYFSKNMRFLSPIYAPVALLAAATVVAAIEWLRPRVPRPAHVAIAALVVVGLLGAAFLDARRFDHYFNEIQIQDLATPWFTKADAGKL
jgi:hypothetical protein